MPALSFHQDPRERLRNAVHDALDGCSFESAVLEDEGMFVVNARRPDSRKVRVRFRGVAGVRRAPEPSPGAVLRLAGVVSSGGLSSLLGLLFPALHGPPPRYSRVRIAAGEGRIVIDCQDAEWWEEAPPPLG